METRPEKRALPLETPAPAPRLVHPTLWDAGNGMLHWRMRYAIELGTLGATCGAMLWNAAPGWTFALLLYVATRSSRLEDAARAAALQSTEKVRLEAIENTLDRVVDRVDRVLHPNATRQQR